MVNAAGDLLVHKSDTWQFQIPVLIAAIIVLIRWRRDIVLLAMSVGAILMAHCCSRPGRAATTATGFFTLTTALMLTFGMAIAAIPSRSAVTWSAPRCLVVVACAATSRIDAIERVLQISAIRDDADRIDEAGGHGAGAAGHSRQLRDVHPTMDKYFIYRILGGRIDPGAPTRLSSTRAAACRIE